MNKIELYLEMLSVVGRLKPFQQGRSWLKFEIPTQARICKLLKEYLKVQKNKSNDGQVK